MWQTDGQTSCHSIVRAVHARHVVKIYNTVGHAKLLKQGGRKANNVWRCLLCVAVTLLQGLDENEHVTFVLNNLDTILDVLSETGTLLLYHQLHCVRVKSRLPYNCHWLGKIIAVLLNMFLPNLIVLLFNYKGTR